MKALLDTHTFLWWTTNDSRLSSLCHQIIRDPNNQIYLSAASAWEIAIKVQIGKLTLPEPAETFVPGRVSLTGFLPLPISVEHTLKTASLPLLHRDPFDRLLIAQSQLENAPILTTDPLLVQYAVSTLW